MEIQHTTQETTVENLVCQVPKAHKHESTLKHSNSLKHKRCRDTCTGLTKPKTPKSFFLVRHLPVSTKKYDDTFIKYLTLMFRVNCHLQN